MSTSSEALLFYGYVVPVGVFDEYEEEHGSSPWSEAHTKEKNGCSVGIFGYDKHLGYYLAVKESLHRVEWDEVCTLDQDDFQVKFYWDDQLYEAAKLFAIDLAGFELGWHLVHLHF